jgi:hypothetical protein
MEDLGLTGDQGLRGNGKKASTPYNPSPYPSLIPAVVLHLETRHQDQACDNWFQGEKSFNESPGGGNVRMNGDDDGDGVTEKEKKEE